MKNEYALVDFTPYSTIKHLPFDKFQTYKFSVHVTDKNWNYVFVNKFVEKISGKTSEDLIGRNIWECFPKHAADANLVYLRNKAEKGIRTIILTTSPLVFRRMSVQTFPLADGYLLFVSIIPDKEELIGELRNALSKNYFSPSDI